MPLGQTEWPELVDMDAQQAKEKLEQETSYRVFLVEAGSMVTMDYRRDRVRIFYSQDTNKVVRVPRVG